MKKKQQINMNISDGDAMFVHEASVQFTPTQFLLDFKQITPRVDPRGSGSPSLLLQHQVMMMEPWHLKQLVDVIGESIKKYEKKYGKIDKPEAIKKAEEERKKRGEEDDEEEDTARAAIPSYLG